jgi:hypothetical protein
MKFRTKVILSGNATAVEVPKSVVEALDSGPRPLIAVTINGHTWRSRIALMRGQCLIGISAGNRTASGIGEGEVIEVNLRLDTEPRVVAVPPDLAGALNSDPEIRAAFDRLPYGLKRKEIASIEEAKAPETRQRRVSRLIARMRAERH